MRISIVGAGPTGLLMGAALGRRDHQVTLIDRDLGPSADEAWERRGVMQFRHAHLFRKQVVQVLKAELPNAYERWLELGAEPMFVASAADGGDLMGVRSQRSTFERALREVVLGETDLELRHGHVDGVAHDAGKVRALTVDGETLLADLVIDASGRSGSIDHRGGERESFGGPCGLAYVDRKYRLNPGADLGPLSHPMLLQLECDGYQVLVFPHEHGLFSAVIVRPDRDPHLKLLRHTAAYEAAANAIPGLSDWIDPDRSSPVSPVLPGANLINVYRSQRTAEGQPVLRGLMWVGDAVATTTPTFGRGVAMAFGQCQALLAALDRHGADVDAAGDAFHEWCESDIRPWVQDHVEVDTGLAQRWAGQPIDPTAWIPSDLVLEASRVDPTIMEAGSPYLTMDRGPDVLDAARPAARAVYDTGWRPPLDPGPSRTELTELVLAAT